MKHGRSSDHEENCYLGNTKEAINIHRMKPALNRDVVQELPPVILVQVSCEVNKMSSRKKLFNYSNVRPNVQLLQVTIQHLMFERNIKEATDAARIHHQLVPNILRVEPGITKVSCVEAAITLYLGDWVRCLLLSFMAGKLCSLYGNTVHVVTYTSKCMYNPFQLMHHHFRLLTFSYFRLQCVGQTYFGLD